MTCTHEPGRKNNMISKSMHVSLGRKHPNKKDPRRSTPSQLVGPRHMHLDLRARVPTSLSRGQEGVSAAVISITLRGTAPKQEVSEASGSLAKVSTLTVEVVTDTGEGDTSPPEPLPKDTGQSDEPNGLDADSSTEMFVTPASNAVGPVLHLEVTIADSLCKW